MNVPWWRVYLASRLQRRGHWFDPSTAHSSKSQVNGLFSSLFGCEHTFNAARNPTKIQHTKSVSSTSAARVDAKSNKSNAPKWFRCAGLIPGREPNERGALMCSRWRRLTLLHDGCDDYARRVGAFGGPCVGSVCPLLLARGNSSCVELQPNTSCRYRVASVISSCGSGHLRAREGVLSR